MRRASWSFCARHLTSRCTTGAATPSSPERSSCSVGARTSTLSSFHARPSNSPTCSRSLCRLSIVPEHAVDAQSLLAAADLVISAGGTMNREAVALGVPVYTVFAGRLGGVDEQLIRDGRLRLLTDPQTIDVTKWDARPTERIRRDPRELLEILLPTTG